MSARISSAAHRWLLGACLILLPLGLFAQSQTFQPTVGQTFQILTFGSHTGTFAATTLPPLGPGLALQVNYNATNVTLQVVASP